MASSFNLPFKKVKLPNDTTLRDTLKHKALFSPYVDLPVILPPSPQMQSFQIYSDIPVSYNTGVPDISIPLYTLKSGGVAIPIVLRYHAHNVKPYMANSTNVAVGWTLDFGGTLSRSIVGGCDENLEVVDITKRYSENNDTDFRNLNLYAENAADAQSDWFQYSLPTGEQAQFFLSRKSYTGSFSDQYDYWLYPNTEARIDISRKQPDVFGTVTLTDRNGFIYKYGGDYEEDSYNGKVTGWMLYHIEDPRTNRTVDYTYESYINDDETMHFFSSPYSILYDEDPRCSYFRSSGGVRLMDQILHPRPDCTVCDHKYENGVVYLEEICLGAKRRDNEMTQTFGYRTQQVKTIRSDSETITFTYSATHKITEIRITTADGQLVRRIVFTLNSVVNKSPLLSSITIYGTDTSSSESYRFDYNPGWTNKASDYWGFHASGRTSSIDERYTQQRELTYTTLNGSLSTGFDFHIDGIRGNPTTTLLGSTDFSAGDNYNEYLLNKITYPTGGYSLFEYEKGRYGQNNKGGGPRIKSITDVPLTGNNKTRTFTYSNGELDVDPQYLDAYLTVTQEVTNMNGRTLSKAQRLDNQPHFGLEIDVTYPEVEVLYQNGSNSYKEKFLYNTRSSHLHGMFSWLNQYTYPYVKDFFYNPLKGKLLRKQVFDSSSKLLREERYDYRVSDRKLINNLLVLKQINGVSSYAEKVAIGNEEDYGFLAYPIFQYDYYSIHIPNVTLNKKTEICVEASDTLVNVETYDYVSGSDVRLTAERLNCSDGGTFSRQYSYVNAGSPNGSALLSRNMIGLIENSVRMKGNSSETVTNSYSNNGLLSQITCKRNNETPYTYHTFTYDAYGNIASGCATDNQPVYYLWGYGNRYPVAMIEGLAAERYAVLRSSFPNTGSCSNNTTMKGHFNTLRNLLANEYVHITTCLYDMAKGTILESTSPSTETTTYAYDGLSRLTQIKDCNGKVVSKGTYVLGSRNYILSQTLLDANGSSSLDHYQYYDGLGRPFEEVTKNFSPTGEHRIILQEYDNTGRKDKEWLPYLSTSDYVSPSDLKGRISSECYGGDSRPYQSTVYEYSTLNRPLQQYVPGAEWSGHPSTVAYRINSKDAPYNCKYYSVNTLTGDLVESGQYPKGELFVVRTSDEDGNTVYTFTDKQQRNLLVRQMQGSVPHDTYYVYDDFGDLRYVLPPMYQESPRIDLYAYCYRYDERGRCIEKQLPGCEAVKYVYDKADHLILSQDGEQRRRSPQEWTFSLYDKYNRQVLQGLCTNTDTNPISSRIVTTTFTTGSGIGGSGYTSNLDLSSPVVHQSTYYDDYRFRALGGFSGDSHFPAGTVNATGYPTGGITSILGNNGKQLYHAGYYDTQGRIIQQVSTNDLGGYQTTTTDYTFTGKPLKEVYSHTADGKPSQTEQYTYAYDRMERLTQLSHQLNNNTSVALVQNTYDKFGRPYAEKYHNGTFQTLFTYNIHNSLTGISGSQFSQNLYYQNSPGTPCYNGNISAMTWQTGTASEIRGYKFTYDGLNRLTNSVYGEGSTLNQNTTRYSESQSYDKMGNILTILRNGKRTDGSFGPVDNLALAYTGNQLQKVTNTVTSPAGGMHFMDGANQEVEYLYDANGNLKQDQNKGITAIQYNTLNLPQKISYANGYSADYRYLADGTKLQVNQNSGSSVHTTDYSSNIVYRDHALAYIFTPKGYITLNGTTPIYHYYLKDHLGNNRVVVDQSGTVEETNHYYPFGCLFGESASIQPYKYNGKELDTANNLNWYDYGARMYDAAIGRWHMVDPMSEKYYLMSPYNYCGNNPVKFIDPDGKNWRIWTQFNAETKKMEYNITVNAVLYNNSSDQDIDMNQLAASITQQITSVFTITGDDFVTTMDFNMRVVTSVDEIGESDHVFRVVDQKELDSRYVKYTSGQVPADTRGLDVRISSEFTKEIISRKNIRTVAHELGHTGGLHDLDKVKENRDRLMMQAVNVENLGGTLNKAVRIPHNDIRIIRDNYIQNKLNHSSPIKLWYGKKYISR